MAHIPRNPRPIVAPSGATARPVMKTVKIGNQLDKKKNCGCGQTPCITYGKKDLTKEGAAWTKKSGKKESGGLNEKGR